MIVPGDIPAVTLMVMMLPPKVGTWKVVKNVEGLVPVFAVIVTGAVTETGNDNMLGCAIRTTVML